MKLHGNMNVKDDELYIGEHGVTSLAKEYGTPLYIMDKKDFKDRAKLYRESFVSEKMETEVIYASKALLNLYMADLVHKEGLSIDVVSGGELWTVLKSGFPKEKIYFHGNNKLEKELKFAVESEIGCIILDNKQELEDLNKVLEGRNYKQKVLLRVNPGIEAHTHEYIKTSKDDSKFGESIYDEDIFSFIERINNSENIDFVGLHCHIGSQVFEKESFYKTAEVMMDFIKDVEDKTGIEISDLNLGGGFGAYYIEGDKPMELSEFLRELVDRVQEYNDKLGLNLKKLHIEPGRSLVTNSGSTLYTVGSTKKTFGGREYIFIDGGMTDNPRPSLYQAEYEAIVANKASQKPEKEWTIAGKCCESGDILIEDIKLPIVEKDDLILVSSTGAYNYSMSSNYNRIEKPAMIFIDGKDIDVAIKRQTYEDLIRDDVF